MCTSHCSFEPDLNLAAIRIGGVCVGNAGSELATTKQAPSGAFDLGDGTVDVVGVHQPKTEMCDAAAETRSEEHTSELQSLRHLVCRLLLEKKQHQFCRATSNVHGARTRAEGKTAAVQ